MKNSASREKILSKIGQKDRPKESALLSDFSFFNNDDIFFLVEDKVETFKSELEAISGKCFLSDSKSEQFSQVKRFLETSGINAVYCKDQQLFPLLEEFQIPFTSDEAQFMQMQAGITSAEFLVARTGSVVVSSAGDSGRQMYVFPPIHIVLADFSQIVNYPDEAILAFQEKYGKSLPSSMSFISGPSRTADIEKTLVLGAHGPKEFAVFLCLQ